MTSNEKNLMKKKKARKRKEPTNKLKVKGQPKPNKKLDYIYKFDKTKNIIWILQTITNLLNLKR